MKPIFALIFILSVQIPKIHCADSTQPKVEFAPKGFTQIRTDKEATITVTITDAKDVATEVELFCRDESLCEVVSPDRVLTVNWTAEEPTVETNVTVRALFLGLTDLVVRIDEREFNYPLRLLREDQSVGQTVFNIVAGIFIIWMTFMIGTQLEWERIVHIAKRPIGPAIAFCLQFLCMPLVAYAIAKNVFTDRENALRIALFTVGCSPGGGKSSFWTIIFNGNLDLSICMTFFETVSALVMMPLWLYTLGHSFFDEHVQLPLLTLIRMILMIVVPTAIGVAFTHFCSSYVKKLRRVLKTVTWVATVVFMVLGLYLNLFIFRLFTVRSVLASCALAWTGYTIAFIAAICLRQTLRDSITIAIETGIQNMAVVLSVILYALPEPERDMALIVPLAIGILTDKPLLIIYLIRKIRKRWLQRKEVCSKNIPKYFRIPKIVGFPLS